MQQIIAFLVNCIRSFVETCVNNELLAWGVFLCVLSAIMWVFATLYRR